MGGYLHKTRAAAKPQTSTDAQDIDARSAASDGSAGQSPAHSLLQLRQALDDSPRVRQHAALQRALDQRAAPAKKKSKEKPALQMKGIAINDDAGLEREADVMGARARALPQAEANAASTPASRAGAWAATIQRGGGKKGKRVSAEALRDRQQANVVQGQVADLKKVINKYSKGGKLNDGLGAKELKALIEALDDSIPKRRFVHQAHLAVGEKDPGNHPKWIEVEVDLLAAAEQALDETDDEDFQAKADSKDVKAAAAPAADSKDVKAASGPKKKLTAKEENKRARKKEKRAAAKANKPAGGEGGDAKEKMIKPEAKD